MKDRLSKKPIPPRERLIVALDVPTTNAAEALVDVLGDAVRFYKIGLELFMTGGYFRLLEKLLSQGCKVFVDLKLFDVPETVAAAVRQLRDRGATFVTVHGNEAILRAACEAKGPLQVLAVTVLTSLDQNDIMAMGFPCTVSDLALHRARKALEAGCDGIISSPLEAPRVRDEVGDQLLVVTPGIRPSPAPGSDDQKRIATPEDAFRNGADHIVVGRPIRNAPDPRAEAERIQATIAGLFAS